MCFFVLIFFVVLLYLFFITPSLSKIENLKEISGSCWTYPFPCMHLKKFLLAKNKFTIREGERRRYVWNQNTHQLYELKQMIPQTYSCLTYRTIHPDYGP